MNPRETILNTVLAPLEWVVRAATPSGPWFLTYHGVGEGDHNISLPVETFRKHVEWIAESEFEVMTLTEFFDRGEPRNAVVFTFDDGTRGQYENAAQILTEHGMSGVFFITTGFVGEEGYIDWSDAQSLSKYHEIGSHTVTHPDLASVEDDAELHQELIESRETLRKRTSVDISFLAAPYGKTQNISSRLGIVIESSGYRGVCTTTGTLPGQYEVLPGDFEVIERTPINVCDIKTFRNIMQCRRLARIKLRAWKNGSSGDTVRDIFTSNK